MGYDYETSPEAGRDPMSLSDMFSVFFDDGNKEDWGSNLCNNSDDDDSDDTVNSDTAGNKAFWEAQHQLLQDALNRGSSIEKRIRADTEAALASAPAICRCAVVSPVKGHCRDCAMRDAADRLRGAGYNSALCKSKWRRSPDIPSGEHGYVDVVVEAKKSTTTTTTSPVRVVIELNFRTEFEMARAGPEYISLVARLPEVFVGKSEKLRNVIKIVCGAAKKCMKENKMHLGPWRKHKYMQSKWLGPYQRTLAVAPPLPVAATVSDRQRKMRASMLTFDLHCTAVEVLSLAPMVHHVPQLLAQF